MTVQPDRKVMAGTGKTPMASSTGLMIMPPPMPQTVPSRQAAKAMPQQINRTMSPDLSFSRQTGVRFFLRYCTTILSQAQGKGRRFSDDILHFPAHIFSSTAKQ